MLRTKPVERPQETAAELGHLLRVWRESKGRSQMQLELQSGVSARHISFIENGRSGAALDTVLRLAKTLDIPLRDRNALIVAAGFQPYYRETGLSEIELEQVRISLTAFLEDQEPFPAFAMDRGLRLVMTNRALEWMLPLFCDPERLWGAGPRRAIDMLLSPDGLRPYISNWDTVVPWLLGLTWREAYAGSGDPLLQAEFHHQMSFPDVAEYWREPKPGETISPIGEIHLKKFGIELPFRFVYFTFGTTEDTYVQHLRIICGHPVNEAARRFGRWLARTRGRKALESFR